MKQNKQQEKDWHTQKIDRSLKTKFFRNKLIYNEKRARYSYHISKLRLAKVIKNKYSDKVERMLIAPCGGCSDYPYLKDCAQEFHGIDLSEIAIERCDKEINTKVGDILKTGYEDNYFDIIVSTLFWHHIKKIGYNEFMNEFYRILKPRGSLIILEPNLFYPLNVITRPIKKIFKNPYGEVENEGPIRMKKLILSMRSSNFRNIKSQGACFTHPVMYKPIAKFINYISTPFLKSPLKQFSWLFILYCEK